MEISPISYFENLKRYWRRRRYQKLSGANIKKRKLQVTRLGDGKLCRHSKPRRTMPKLKLRIVSPLHILSKFHDSYVEMTKGLASSVIKSANNGGVLAGKKVAKEKQITLVSCGEEVDSRLVLEIYKRLAASRSVSTY